MLKRKIDDVLLNWKKGEERLPLIVKGARQIGKTFSIRRFGQTSYKRFIEVNFILQRQYRDIFNDGFEVDSILRNMTLHDPTLSFDAGETLIFFDEIQACPDCATSLKSFKLDGRFDVICSGSLMGLNYSQIESNSVGYKQDYLMQSLDFEEFLWAKGYKDEIIEDMYASMVEVRPLSKVLLEVMAENFREYMVLGGMPSVIDSFVEKRNFSGALAIQRQLLLDYEEDITKYALGLDHGKISSVYRKIPVFLGKENKKFQITKVAHGARLREYEGVVDWLKDAGIVNVCHCLSEPKLPLKGNYRPDVFKLYFADTGLLIASLDDEAQDDLRNNRNFNTYKGAIYENAIGEALSKQGYGLYFYRNEKSTLEIDFLLRDASSLVPVEVKANDGPTASLNKLIDSPLFEDVEYGIKLGNKNIGWNGRFFTFPYFLSFLLKRFLKQGQSVYNRLEDGLWIATKNR